MKDPIVKGNYGGSCDSATETAIIATACFLLILALVVGAWLA